MNYRTISIGIVGFWAVMMTLLFRREVLPRLTAGDPPAVLPSGAGLWKVRQSQAGVYDGRGNRIGTSWSTTQRSAGLVSVRSTLILERLGVLQKPLHLESSVRYDGRGKLEEIRIDLIQPVQAHLTGATIGQDFSIDVRVAGIKRTIVLDARTTSQLGQIQQPFALLGDLKVGMRWRIHQIDALSIITRKKLGTRMVLVEVESREKIKHLGGEVECYRVRVEPNITVWVDPQGRIIRQEGYLPFIGKTVWLAEPYRDRDREEARYKVGP